MPWTHEWWCPICWALLLLRVAYGLIVPLLKAYTVLFLAPLHIITNPTRALLKVARWICTPVRVPVVFLLVVCCDRF